MHIAMLRRTVLSREISSGKNPEIRENRTNSTLVRPPILFGLISIMMLILVSSTGHGGDVELKDSVKAMHTCSWSTGATDSVNEGTTAVETLSATSDSSGTCSYSIVGGVDSETSQYPAPLSVFLPHLITKTPMMPILITSIQSR